MQCASPIESRLLSKAMCLKIDGFGSESHRNNVRGETIQIS